MTKGFGSWCIYTFGFRQLDMKSSLVDLGLSVHPAACVALDGYLSQEKRRRNESDKLTGTLLSSTFMVYIMYLRKRPLCSEITLHPWWSTGCDGRLARPAQRPSGPGVNERRRSRMAYSLNSVALSISMDPTTDGAYH
jgi:hypothetical protein